jgi:alpha-beta hydrolase superfamily lysophospholipase
VQWVNEAMGGMSQVRKLASQVSVPFLLFIGTHDRVVRISDAVEFCKKAVACAATVLENGRHMLLIERDKIRSRLMDKIFAYFGEPSRLAPPAPQ